MKALLVYFLILLFIAIVEGVVIYYKQLEIYDLKNKLWNMSGLPPVFCDDDVLWRYDNDR